MTSKQLEHDYEPPPEYVDDEERDALLNTDKLEEREHDVDQPRHLHLTLLGIGSLLFIGFATAILVKLLPTRPPPADVPSATDLELSSGLRSNGTHLFNKTVIMVSIDGLRADYLDRGLTPHLFDISQVGLRAKHMQPIFPTITFPNHWSLLTGLYAESHGIVGNHFFDDQLGEFVFSDARIASESGWWQGEPIWAALEKASVVTANIMWPGPYVTREGTTPTYLVPFRNHVPMHEKHDKIMSWIDMDLKQRPQLIIAYEPSLDQAGHATGPGSALVNATLVEIDSFARNLHQSLQARNLSHIVDIIFVSDHGMADTTHIDFVYLEDIIGKEGVDAVEREDGWPSMGLRFKQGSNVSSYVNTLGDYASANPGTFKIYTHATMPPEYHFAKNPRISPIFLVPDVGHALSLRHGQHNVNVKGNHGFDNNIPAMQAIFVADGPFASRVKSRDVSRRSNLSGYQGYVIDGFRNVEVKALVGRLLDLELPLNSHNGTEGFWDQYL